MLKPGRLYYNAKYACNLRKFLLMLRVIKNLFLAAVLRRKVLRYCDINVTSHCNLHCEHCFAVNFEKKGKQPLSIEEYALISKQIQKLGNIMVGFTGGEPVLCRDIEKIIEAFEPKKNYISLITNGTLLNEDKIKRYKEIGVDILTISLDSGIPEEHDAFRGWTGAFKRTLENIQIAMKHGLKVAAVCTVTHKSVRSEGLQRLIDLTKNLRIMLILGLISPAGKYINRDENLLTKEDVGYIDDVTKQYAHVRRDWETNYITKGCGAAKEKLYITQYGEVMTCPFIHVSFGSIRDTEVAEIRRRMLALPVFAGYPKKCLAAEDKEFMKQYMKPCFGKKEHPIDIREIQAMSTQVEKEKKIAQ